MDGWNENFTITDEHFRDGITLDIAYGRHLTNDYAFVIKWEGVSSVEIRGSYNGWGVGTQLTKLNDTDPIFVLENAPTTIPGTYYYKFYADGNYEPGNNRELIIPMTEGVCAYPQVAS